MVDNIDSKRRSEIMSRIRAKNTTPEMAVRRVAHRLGFRFRLHVRQLPGSPDLVFPSRKVAIFVHGCFWHRHAGCKSCFTPKTRTEFWENKFARNVSRDKEKATALTALGWKVITIWECETKNEIPITNILKKALPKIGKPTPYIEPG